MIKVFRASLLAVIVCSAGAAAAQDGTITFTGSIADVTCDISGGDDANPTQGPDFTVTLPQVSATALKNKGQRAGDTRFKINLSGGNCTNGKVASAYFELAHPTSIDVNTGDLINTIDKASGGADQVQIGLSDKNKKAFNLTTVNANPQTVTIANNQATLEYWAQYVAQENDAVTAGKVTAEVAYSIKYN